MKFQLMGVAIVAGLLAQETAHAADLGHVTVTRTTRVSRMTPIVTERAIARLADQDLGYSVLHEPIGGVPQRGYRVHVTCTITETFRQTYCPTPAYVATCPDARIICQ
ncbi:hypothetical protein MHY87_09290 [Microvirga sp. ACRRW]|uniref:hypothetical protein n=1 Tax=Microvirga sp. ACRRW TaxID=2918205 RepID=UPI001EF713F4|nr:hypothetical protein [Microvirga sp. ACRRW]MCG7393098.1 hypothetical protein [Microvirga sp. ACRRW]